MVFRKEFERFTVAKLLQNSSMLFVKNFTVHQTNVVFLFEAAVKGKTLIVCVVMM